MNSVAQKIDFAMMSDDEPELPGCELSMTSVSSGCDTDEFHKLSPSPSPRQSRREGVFQQPAMTSSPRRLSRPLSVQTVARPGQTPLSKLAGRPVRDRLNSASPSPPYKRIKGERTALPAKREQGPPETPPSEPVDACGRLSPPYKRIKGLHLGDSPTTPRTLLEECMQPPQAPRDLNANSLVCSRPEVRKVASRTRLLVARSALEREQAARPAANINPFTPRGRLLRERKRLRDSASDGSVLSVSADCSTDDAGDTDDALPTKRLALSDANVSRLDQEFMLQEEIGSGQFGQVFRCTNRLDGCTYAIKRSRKPVAGSSHERSALNEVYAHAVLGKHQYIVRYYSAWAEKNHMLIQNEFCTRGSLAALLEKHQRAGTHMSEPQIKRMVTHVARGLRYVHSMHLSHLDLKPGNIFLTDNEFATGGRGGPAGVRADDDSSVVSSDDGFDEDLGDDDDDCMYKIGDFGHVTSEEEHQVEEGDCRYMSREILLEDYSCLSKADMFALGLTAYECASGRALPKNGQDWQTLRNGQLPPLPAVFSPELHQLIQLLIDPEPARRPSAAELLAHPSLQPASCRSRAQLRRQLNCERLQNQLLRSQLADISAHGSPERSSPGRLLLGKGTRRSRSTNF